MHPHLHNLLPTTTSAPSSAASSPTAGNGHHARPAPAVNAAMMHAQWPMPLLPLSSLSHARGLASGRASPPASRPQSPLTGVVADGFTTPSGGHPPTPGQLLSKLEHARQQPCPDQKRKRKGDAKLDSALGPLRVKSQKLAATSEDSPRPRSGKAALNRKGRANKSSRFRGVSQCRKDGRFQARIRVGAKVKYLGRFKTETEAALCYDTAAAQLHGDHAHLNFPQTASEERSRFETLVTRKVQEAAKGQDLSALPPGPREPGADEAPPPAPPAPPLPAQQGNIDHTHDDDDDGGDEDEDEDLRHDSDASTPSHDEEDEGEGKWEEAVGKSSTAHIIHYNPQNRSAAFNPVDVEAACFLLSLGVLPK